MAKSELNWLTIDIATLTQKQREAYDAYKKAYAQMKADREWFEETITATVDVPTGKRVVFGYMFGKLSVALADDDAKRTSKAKPAASLADLAKR